MLMLPAGFANCTTCGRLLVVDSLNVNGRCVSDCGGTVGDVYRPFPTQFPRLAAIIDTQLARWRGALDRMAER